MLSIREVDKDDLRALLTLAQSTYAGAFGSSMSDFHSVSQAHSTSRQQVKTELVTA